jgi:hypothetical protein
MGCARNDVDSEELAGRLEADGWTLVSDVEDAEVAVVFLHAYSQSFLARVTSHIPQEIDAHFCQLLRWNVQKHEMKVMSHP